MWKKVLIACFALVGTFSVCNMYYDMVMEATSTTMKTSLSVRTGAVNSPEGSLFVLGEFDGKEIIFEGIKNNVTGGMLAMVQGGIGRFGLCNMLNCNVEALDYTDTTLYYIETNMNKSLSRAGKDNVIREVFIPTKAELQNGGTFALNQYYRLDSHVPAPSETVYTWNGLLMEDIWTGYAAHLKDDVYSIKTAGKSILKMYTTEDGIVSLSGWNVCAGHVDSTDVDKGTGMCQDGPVQHAYVVRPAVILDTEKFAFALEKDLIATQIVSIDNASKNILKLRFYDDNFSINIQSETKEVVKGGIIKIPYTASTGENQHLTAMFYDTNGNVKYYQDLGSISASGIAEIGTSTFQIGEILNIRLINEEVTMNNQPVRVSQMSDSYHVTIVDPLEVTYTPSSSSFTYDKDAKAGDTVGTLSFKNGVKPITYTLSANKDHPSDVSNFALSKTQVETDGETVNVTVANGGPAIDPNTTSLKAGTYYFTITAVDDNGDPVDDEGNPTQTIDVVVVVNKAEPKITFDTNDQGTVTITGSITETIDHIDHATHTNKDIINKQGGGSDVDILYTQDSGTNGLFTGLPYTATTGGDLTITTVANKSGSIVLKAHIDKTDNYKEANTTKTIKVELGLEAEYIEDKKAIKAGSTEAKPSSTTSIGHISVSGGSEPYSYAPKTGANQNSSFTINQEGKIYVSDGVGDIGLTPGNYIIEVEVSDSTAPTAQKVTVKKTITIGEADLSGVSFEDPDNAGQAVSSITRTYDPASSGGSFHTKLIETTSGTLKDTTIKYSLDPGSNEVLDMGADTGTYANFTIKKASSDAEKDTIKIKALVKGGVYGTTGKTITINVNVDPYTQEIQFEQKAPYELLNTSDCVSIPATRKSTYWNESASNKIKYTSSDIKKATIDASGNVCPVSGASGTITLSAELAKDDNYTKATADLKINILGELKLDYEEGTVLQAVNPNKENDAGTAKSEAEAGTLKVTGGTDKQYDIQIKSDDYAYAYLETKTTSDKRTSTLKLKPGVTITADILKAGIDSGVIVQDETNKDQYNWTINVEPDKDMDAQEITVAIIGADPVLTFEQESDKKITLTYKKDGIVDLSVKRGNNVMKSGISVEGSLGYGTYIGTLSGITTDAQLNVISIKKANCDDLDNVLSGKSFTVTPTSEASDGYQSGTGTATPVIIKKADHPKVNFKDADTILSSYVTSIEKAIEGIEKDDDHLTIEPLNPDTWSGTTFEKYNSGDTTAPTVTITPDGYEGTVTYVVNGGGTANYKPIKELKISLAFSKEGGITYKPIKITYGDDTKKVIDFITDEIKDNCTYTYQPVSGDSYVDENQEEVFTLDNDTSTMTTKQVGKTKIKVTRTDGDGNTLSQSIPVEIIKKEITLTYASKTIYTGEALPAPSFKAVKEGVLVKNDTLDLFTMPNSAGHYKGTGSLTVSKTAGAYDIKGNWTSEELETGILKNYKVTLEKGTLTIKKDTVTDPWYHLENDKKETVSKDDWHNSYIDVVLDQALGDAGTYDQISEQNTFTNADKTRFTVSEEDEHKQSIYFRIDPASDTSHKGAITDTQTTIKIDMSDPNINSITGYPVNQDGLSELLNNLTFGTFFKPGVEVVIQTEDPQPANETGKKVSGVKEVTYKVYTLDKTGKLDAAQTPTTGTGSVDTSGAMSFKIKEPGNYRVCAIALDHATNTSKESCSDLNVKKLDIDVDDDDIPDFNDTDDDGCPDLNIVLGTDKEGNKVKLNIAEKDKKYPYMNIDSDGANGGKNSAGTADLNIDTDNDQKPDLNLVVMKEEDWKNAKTCVLVDKLTEYSEPIEYCTGTDAKAQINVDTNGDGIPEINIDTNGDMIADINIDQNHNGILDEYDFNITSHIKTWNPNQNYTKQSFLYDTETNHTPYINVIVKGTDVPSLNIDLDGDGLPDLNIDADHDGIPETNIDITGDGIADINLDPDQTGTPISKLYALTNWTPGKVITGDEFNYMTMILEGTKELADQGISVSPSNPNQIFLPNYALKVDDITASQKETIEQEASDLIKEDQEVKTVYDVKLLEDQVEIQPDGSLKVRVPLPEGIENPEVLVKKSDGTYEKVTITIKDGYLEYETEELGVISIIGPKETVVPDPDPDNPKPDEPDKPTPTNPDEPNADEPKTVQPKDEALKPSVQGSYMKQPQSTTTGMGGASTGDSSNIVMYIGFTSMSLGILFLILYKRKDHKEE